ncbi:MAG: arylsulfatase A-like enzyme [Cryomorphaceae bacterium]|jgi:arylsulfatase A-like enzyme
MKKPNVLFIFADDLRPELNCYGCEHVISPNIDRLASKGCLFEKSYVQIAVCNTSRASMLTGKRPDDLSVWGLDTHFRESSPDVVNLPQHFKQQGIIQQQSGKFTTTANLPQFLGRSHSYILKVTHTIRMQFIGMTETFIILSNERLSSEKRMILENTLMNTGNGI